MLETVWEVNYGKYVNTEVIKCWWSKAMIFPATWETYINRRVGSEKIVESHKVLSKEF